MMNITENRNDNTLSLLIEGRIDTATAPKLEQVMQTALDGVTELFLDLKDTVYISSAGLRVLLSAQKQMNRYLRMVILTASLFTFIILLIYLLNTHHFLTRPIERIAESSDAFVKKIQN